MWARCPLAKVVLVSDLFSERDKNETVVNRALCEVELVYKLRINEKSENEIMLNEWLGVFVFISQNIFFANFIFMKNAMNYFEKLADFFCN